MNTALCTLNGRPVAYERVMNRYWIGGRGYVFISEVLVWNPTNPSKTVLLSPGEFDALTAPARTPARLAA